MTRNHLAILIGAGAIAVAVGDRFIQPSPADAVAVEHGPSELHAPDAPGESLSSIFENLPVGSETAGLLSQVMRSADRAGVLAPESELQSPAPTEPRTRVLPVLTAVTTASGGVAVIDGQVLRIGQSHAGMRLLDVTGRSATVLIDEDIVTLTIR